MNKTVVVMFALEEGKQLIEELQKRSVPIKAALWLYFDEADEWRLVLATPLADSEGPRKTYERVQEALKANEDTIHIRLRDISVVSPEDDVVRPLREALNDRPVDNGKFVRRSIITGGKTSVYLEEAYIYFARM